MSDAATARHRHSPETVVDPVCGMTISPEDAVGSETFEGRTYHFCSRSCLDAFRTDPRRFADGTPGAREGAHEATPPAGGREAGGAEYTCPMHPEVRQVGPGSCPRCGMALEPVAPAAPVTRTEWTCPMHP
ncbi:MAG TPA: YHS domain-containing protein, partial [Thermodesulfobacteriota bacterium]